MHVNSEIHIEEPVVVRLKGSSPRSLTFAMNASVAVMLATFALAAYYVVTDPNARVPVLVALIVGALVQLSIMVRKLMDPIPYRDPTRGTHRTGDSARFPSAEDRARSER